MNHKHPRCEHKKLKFCETCQKVVCETCGAEFSQFSTYPVYIYPWYAQPTYPVPYQPTWTTTGVSQIANTPDIKYVVSKYSSSPT